MRLNPLSEGAVLSRIWPDFDPDPASVFTLDFIGSKMAGRRAYKGLSDRYADAALIPGWSYTGSTSNGQPRYAETRSGVLVAFAANTPRITDRGLLAEELRTNRVTAYNAAPPILVASAALAAFNTAASAYGFTAQNGNAATRWAIVDDAARMTASGLSSATNGRAVVIDNSAGAVDALLIISGVVANTNPHAISAYVAGTGTGSVRLSGSVIAFTALTASYVRRSVVQTPVDTTARSIVVTATPGSILYVILPQLEEGGFVTSPIVTAGSAATRAADVAYITGLGAILGQPFTLVAWADLPASDNVDRTLCEANDGTNANRVLLYRTSGNAAGDWVANGSGSGSITGVGTKTGARVLKVAARVRATSHQSSVDGVLGALTAQTPPAPTRLDIGLRAYAGQHLNGYIQRIGIYGDVDDATLQALTA